MGKWEMVRLGNLITQVRGVSYSPKDTSDVACQGYTPILRANNIQDDGLNFDNLVYVKNNKISSNQLLKKGDIVICASSGSKNLVGKAAQVIADTNVSFGAFCKVVRPENIYYAYLGNYFKGKGYRRIISDLSAGININNLRNENINDLTIPVPPLEVQRKIAETLDAASELLAMRKNQLAELDKLIQSVFYDMFGDPVTNEKGWEVNPLGKLLEKIRYGTSTPPLFCNEGYSFIRATNIKNGRVIESDMKFISAKEASKIEKCRLQVGELIIVRSGVNTGDSCVVSQKLEGHYAGYDLIITLKKDLLNPIFFNEMINTKYMDVVIKPLTRRAAQPHLNAEQASNLNVILPEIELQSQFAETVQKIEEQKSLVQKAIDETQALFDSLMGEYFE